MLERDSIFGQLDAFTENLEPPQKERFEKDVAKHDLVESLVDGIVHAKVMDLYADQQQLEKHLHNDRMNLLTYLQADPNLEQRLVDNDMRIVQKFDELCQRQQAVLNGLRVPSFHLTKNPHEIELQMLVLDFIRGLNPNWTPQTNSE